MMNLPKEHTVISGYLQSFKYFEAIQDVIRQEYIFQDSVANSAAEILHDLYSLYRGSLFVGVHARRGHFLRPEMQVMGYGVPGKSYFDQAFNLMKSKFPGRNITFLVASDDLSWCNETLERDGVVVLPDVPPAVHMAILTSCEHMIISSGTFSWWSGWLANGYVIYYKGYMANNTYLGRILVAKNYYPPLWIGLEN